MALKELLKQRVMERLNFSQEISDDYLKEVIQQEIVKVQKIIRCFYLIRSV